MSAPIDGALDGGLARAVDAASVLARTRMRLLLGIAEAGFFPGIVLYLTYWFPQTERARVVGLFMVAIPLTGLIGSPLSSALLGLDGAGLSTALVPQLLFLCIAALGIYGSLPIFWTFPTELLASTAAAAGIALINCVGNLGGYFGPQIVAAISAVAGRFGPALAVLGGVMLVPGVVALSLGRQRRQS